MPLQLRPIGSNEPGSPAVSAVGAALHPIPSHGKNGIRRPLPLIQRRSAVVIVIGFLLTSFLLQGSHVVLRIKRMAFWESSHSISSTQDKLATKYNTSVRPVQRPNTVLVVPTYGGIGNQLYFLLESLILARQAHLDLVVPTLSPRDFGGLTTTSTAERAGDDFWDVAGLARAVQPRGHVLHSLPASCKAQFDAVYVTRRSDPQVALQSPTIASRVKQVACFLVSNYTWSKQEAPRTQKECAGRIFKDAAVEQRYLPLAAQSDGLFMQELRQLRQQQILPSGSADPSRPACIIVDGHSFNIAGKAGHDYLYSFMHFVNPSPKIVQMISRWSVNELTVLHLRYDENECAPKPGTSGKVCIRVLQAVGRRHTVYWASQGEVVGAILRAMAVYESGLVYLAASPYVPAKTVDALRAELKKSVRVAPLVASSLSHNEQNFIERELAVRSKCFIADFGSTWSGTVYYKRRTLGVKTLWSSVLLGKSQGLGYYEDDNPLPLPEVFETNFSSLVARQRI